MKRGKSIKRGSPHSEKAGDDVLSMVELTIVYRTFWGLKCPRSLLKARVRLA